MTILDRPGLEAIACECYGVISSEYGRLLGGTPHAEPCDMPLRPLPGVR
jgi:hypothetical protein